MARDDGSESSPNQILWLWVPGSRYARPGTTAVFAVQIAYLSPRATMAPNQNDRENRHELTRRQAGPALSPHG